VREGRGTRYVADAGQIKKPEPPAVSDPALCKMREGPMDLSGVVVPPASCVGPSLGVLGFAEDSAVSG